MSDKSATLIVPVYNAGDNINRCFNSILNQTSKDFEVLFVNDGSTDNSLAMIERFCAEHPDFARVVSQENAGVCAARHAGIHACQTKYLLFMDQDDFIDADYIERLLLVIQNDDLDVVICGYRRTTAKKVLLEVPAFRNDSCSRYNFVMPWGRIIRRSILVEHDIRFLDTLIGEDVYFNYILYLHTNKIAFIHGYTGYNWYMNEESVSNTRHAGLPTDCDLLQLLKAIHAKYELFHGRTTLYDYFINRQAVWYLLWSGKTASPKRFIEEDMRLFRWLNDNGYQMKLHFFSKPLWGGERLDKRICIGLYNALHRLHAIPLFAQIYCKKNSDD